MSSETSAPAPDKPELKQVDIRDALKRVLAAAEILSHALVTQQQLLSASDDTNKPAKDGQ